MALTIFLAACGGAHGVVTLSWVVGFSDGEPATCANTETVQLTLGAQHLSFACSAGNNGVVVKTGPVTKGSYPATIALYAGEDKEAEATFSSIHVEDGETTPLGTVFLTKAPPTRVSFTWILQSPDASQSRACDVGETIRVDMGNGVAPITWDCTQHAPYVVTSIPAGDYQPTVTLLNASAPEDGPGEVAPFGDDDSQPVTYQAETMSVIAHENLPVEIIFCVDRSSF